MQNTEYRIQSHSADSNVSEEVGCRYLKISTKFHDYSHVNCNSQGTTTYLLQYEGPNNILGSHMNLLYKFIHLKYAFPS